TLAEPERVDVGIAAVVHAAAGPAPVDGVQPLLLRELVAGIGLERARRPRIALRPVDAERVLVKRPAPVVAGRQRRQRLVTLRRLSEIVGASVIPRLAVAQRVGPVL